jgi:hypothetical protein
MTEDDLRTKIVMPLLEHLGAGSIRDLHGSSERGVDLVYVLEDKLGKRDLEVAQIKNSSFSGKSQSRRNTIAILTQLIQCRQRRVLHPETHRKERPNSVALWTTYPLPDKDTADAGDLLEEIDSQRVRIIGPDRLVELLESWMPFLYEELAFPGHGLTRAIAGYVSVHREANAFDVVSAKRLADFFVNVSVKPQQGSYESSFEAVNIDLPPDYVPTVTGGLSTGSVLFGGGGGPAEAAAGAKQAAAKAPGVR